MRQNDKLMNIFTTAETHNQVIHAITSMVCLLQASVTIKACNTHKYCEVYSLTQLPENQQTSRHVGRGVLSR